MYDLIGLRGARIARGLTQTELAKRATISQRAISKLESRERMARLATLRKLAIALGVPQWQLLQEDRP